MIVSSYIKRVSTVKKLSHKVSLIDSARFDAKFGFILEAKDYARSAFKMGFSLSEAVQIGRESHKIASAQMNTLQMTYQEEAAWKKL